MKALRMLAEEMTVHTRNFAAEYGQVAGGIFNLTAKSGTNTLHAASSSTNPPQSQRRHAQGVTTAGFGGINTGSVFGPPRSGQIVTRLSW